MPIPIPSPEADDVPVPAPPAGVSARPYYIRQHQDWAVEQERQRHIQALYMVGEWVIFVLLWHQADHAAGLVTRCSRCYGNAGSMDRRIAEVYQQPTQNGCPVCYGTTFEGGYRAVIVRPAMITDVDQNDRLDRKGEMHPGNIGVETTVDFRARAGDYVIRTDNTRWQLTTPQRVQLRTGFEHPVQAESGIAYNNFRGKLEERTTVAYQIPPTDALSIRILLSQPMRMPANFNSIEVVRGPLIPPTILD